MTMLRPSQSAAKPEQDHKPKGFRSWPGNVLMQTMFAQNNAMLGTDLSANVDMNNRRKLA